MQPDFQRLFESLPALVMVLAADPPRFTVVAASDAYLKAVKKAREDLIGHPVFEALPVSPEDRSPEVNSRASFQRAIDLRIPDTMAVQRHDLKRPESEGGGFETRYWSPVNTPVLDGKGEVVYVLHRVEDVTEYVQAKQQGAEHQALAEALQSRAGAMEAEIYRRAQEIQQANQRLREANEKLGELDRAKTAFFSNISHEFRTPLTLILGTLEQVLGRDDLPGGTPADLAMAHRNSLRLLRLVNALLDFTRIEAGRAEPSFEPTDIGALTAGLASSFQSACERAGLRLLIDTPSSGPEVYVDRDLWEQIVLNLVSNAFKFTLQGEIDVKVQQTAQGCELVVRDTGIGIPPEEIPRIFERFHRVPSTQGRSLEGTGIGLSLVHELVKLHAGEIRVQSTAGQGSTFTVALRAGTSHLPADRIRSHRAAPPPSTPARAFVEEAVQSLSGTGSFAEEPLRPVTDGTPNKESHGPDTPARARVLLADDNADMRAHVSRLLAPSFDVVAASDGLEALALAQQLRPDLVLTDVMMPRLDGFGLLRRLRADPNLRATPIILISARAGEESKADSLEAGADDYLVKPFSARELVARVTSNLKLAAMREEVARARAREDALADANRRKNMFLAMLSHELRNPLAPIRNSLYILERSAPGGEQARRAHQVIDRQVEHLSRMVEDLLDVSRITQGKMQVQQEQLEMNELVRGAVEDARAIFERNGVALQANVPDEPVVVSGDRTRLAQVVGNLLGNAAKFTSGGGHVELSLFTEGANTAVLSVRDDGSGVEREVLQHLFEPFVQADRTLHRSAGGLGLGLAIVKGLVEAHGGKVSVRSDGDAKGTEFIVRLPLQQPTKPPLTATPAAAAHVRSRRVLIIEDNTDAAESLKEVLELSGYEVDIAYDGVAGLDKARVWRPDAIVSDIGMPRLDGYGVAKAVRADPALRRVCLVAVTGYAALDDVQRSRAAGFDHHFPKPPEVGALQRVLAECTTTSP